MNFLEICQRVFDEGDRAPYTIDTTDLEEDADEQVYKVINWVKQAYREIQQWNMYYSFHLQEGTLFSSEVGTTDYTTTNIRKLIPSSIVAKRPGDATGWELTTISYQRWISLFTNTNLAAGIPSWFTEISNSKYRLTPVPDAIYEITGSWYIPLDVMSYDNDVPIWDEEDHEIIVWVALQYYVSEYETPEELVMRTRQALRYAKQEFLMKYLPDLEITGSFAI